MSQPFDFNQALKQLQSGQALTGQDGILMPLIKQLTEAAIKAEIDHKILSLFSLGTSYHDMQQHIRDLYGIEVSNGTISAVTDQILSRVKRVA